MTEKRERRVFKESFKQQSVKLHNNGKSRGRYYYLKKLSKQHLRKTESCMAAAS